MITRNIGKLLDTAGHGIGKAFARYKVGVTFADYVGERITVTLTADDIDSGKTVLTASTDIAAVGAISVIASNGTIRAVTKAEIDDNELTLTVTALAVGDTVTAIVYA